jgi:hypothetical protein|nr:MAG TPA: hypothetical protein [Caudoviricetes sp.]
MYPVSEKYIEAIRAPVREDRITGGIRLKDGTIIPVDDSIIVQKSLTVTRKVSSSSKFDIGTVNSAEMRIKIRDAKAYDHDFGGAVISLKYGIVTATADDGSETWEDVPLPPFYVDGGEAARKQNMVSLTAHDTLSRLAVDKGSPPTTSFYAALTYFCNRCNVGVAISESDFNALPNADITPDFSAESIQSCWDGVMWIAQTVNCCAFADYRGLVQLKQYKYEGGDNYDRLITGKERTNIEYSDTRTYLAYLQSYEGENVKLYSRVKTWTGTDAPHIKEGALNLPKNPVVQSLSAEQQAAINQSYLNNRSYPTRYVKASGVPDPAIEPLDVLAFSGGTIDIGQIISVATQVTWKYRNGGTIYCANADEYSDAADGTSAIATLSLESDVAEQSDEAPVMRTQPKSQTEKQIDELRKQLSQAGGTAGVLTEYQYLTDASVKFNGTTYTVEKDAETGLISKISDSYNHEFKPSISPGITGVALHNAVFWALAMCRGLGEIPQKTLFDGTSGAWSYSGGLTGFRRIAGNQPYSGIGSEAYTSGAKVLRLSKAYRLEDSEDNYTDAIIIRSNERINLSGYSKLRILAFAFTNYVGLDGKVYFESGEPGAAVPGKAYDFSAWKLVGSCDGFSTNYSEPGTPKWYEADVSALGGNQYLNFGVYHGSQVYAYTSYFDIHKIILIP